MNLEAFQQGRWGRQLAKGLREVGGLKAKGEGSKSVGYGLEGNQSPDIRIEIRNHVDGTRFGTRDVLEGSPHARALELGPEVGRSREDISPATTDA